MFRRKNWESLPFSSRSVVEEWLRPRTGKALRELEKRAARARHRGKSPSVSFMLPRRISNLEVYGNDWSIKPIVETVVHENRVSASVVVFDVYENGHLEVTITSS